MATTRGSRRGLALGVTLLALTVGVAVTTAAALAGAGVCSAPAVDPRIAGSPPDAVCSQLVRTLALRVGVVTAVVTAVLTLTVVGLSRLVVPRDERPL
jgi:hypothetical protein